MPTKVGILYWGQRGGGQLLTDQLVQAASNNKFQLHVFLRPSEGANKSTPIKAYQCLRWLAERRSVLKEVRIAELEVIILPMASPWDLFLGRAFRRNGIRVVRMIHDASPHPGERFPPRFWIRLLCKDSNQIVAFSDYVAFKLVQNGYAPLNKIKVGALPLPDVVPNSALRSEVPRNSFLFIGRGKKYKGLKQLLEAWPSVGDIDSILTVAGEGHRVPLNLPRVRHIDRWLEESEVIKIIEANDVVVLPYLEASQSGIIPIALALNKVLVVTPVGGLIEYVKNGENAVVAKSLRSQDISAAMNDAMNLNPQRASIPNHSNTAQRLLEKCLEEW